MPKTLFVINPNCNRNVTQVMDAALTPLRHADLPRIQCITLDAGPAAIQSQSDVDMAAVHVRRFAEEHLDEAAGFITACFSDPGLHALREIKGTLSLGISECAMLTSLSIGQRVGVIAMVPESIPRHYRAWGAMGISQRVVGEVSIDRSVAALSEASETIKAMIESGRRLKEECGADVLVMGCAGMAAYRDSVEQAIGLPVVEPTQAAVSMALARLRMGW